MESASTYPPQCSPPRSVQAEHRSGFGPWWRRGPSYRRCRVIPMEGRSLGSTPTQEAEGRRSACRHQTIVAPHNARKLAQRKIGNWVLSVSRKAQNGRLGSQRSAALTVAGAGRRSLHNAGNRGWQFILDESPDDAVEVRVADESEGVRSHGVPGLRPTADDTFH